MIRLTLDDGTPVAVNPFHIFAVKPVEGGSFIMANGGAITVRETMDEVETAVKNWTKDKE